MRSIAFFCRCQKCLNRPAPFFGIPTVGIIIAAIEQNYLITRNLGVQIFGEIRRIDRVMDATHVGTVCIYGRSLCPIRTVVEAYRFITAAIYPVANIHAVIMLDKTILQRPIFYLLIVGSSRIFPAKLLSSTKLCASDASCKGKIL